MAQLIEKKRLVGILRGFYFAKVQRVMEQTDAKWLYEILRQEPSPYYGGANIGKGHKHIGGRQNPKDYAKKKKAKRRQQKQARHRNK